MLGATYFLRTFLKAEFVDCGGGGKVKLLKALQIRNTSASGSRIYIYISRCERSVFKSARNVPFYCCAAIYGCPDNSAHATTV